jgi:hypothetical protein
MVPYRIVKTGVEEFEARDFEYFLRTQNLVSFELKSRSAEMIFLYLVFYSAEEASLYMLKDMETYYHANKPCLFEPDADFERALEQKYGVETDDYYKRK